MIAVSSLDVKLVQNLFEISEDSNPPTLGSLEIYIMLPQEYGTSVPFRDPRSIHFPLSTFRHPAKQHEQLFVPRFQEDLEQRQHRQGHTHERSTLLHLQETRTPFAGQPQEEECTVAATSTTETQPEGKSKIDEEESDSDSGKE
jgi:hypothetical protein